MGSGRTAEVVAQRAAAVVERGAKEGDEDARTAQEPHLARARSTCVCLQRHSSRDCGGTTGGAGARVARSKEHSVRMSQGARCGRVGSQRQQ
eukprot:472615-Prymnesium_polylepis.2